MIFKRLANAISQNNWPVLCTEFLVVVIGIFAGFQLDNWNEDRKDRNDEQLFLGHLHQDIIRAEELSARVRSRRLATITALISSSDILFKRAAPDELTSVECIAIASSSYFNMNVSPLPAYNELIGTGRLGIIEDISLRTALVEFQQSSEALDAYINVQTAASVGSNLGAKYPNLIKLESFYNPSDKEMHSVTSCNLAAMRTDQAFLNDFAISADRYDAYISDGLAPWSRQFERLHELLDASLNLNHNQGNN